MSQPSDLLSYYRARANEYEKVYAKPERQADLSVLHAVVPDWAASRHVLDVACGTGYWTRRIAARAAAVTACDRAPETLEVARTQQPPSAPADFLVGDAFALEDIPGAVDAAFVGFFWSHIPRANRRRFLRGLHRRLPRGSRVLILDNRYVAGSNWPITRVDTDGNTYQHRVLDDGTAYEVLKNFPPPDELSEVILSAGAVDLAIHESEYYWYAAYLTQ
jgi:demethylmenaquinone methyltransferase/2-methoxy-6-polyprenyl-1,4-benzoquinol methylase